LKILDKLSKDGIVAIDFSGGEPLTHPNFLEILEYALNKFGLVQILTNATLINEDHIHLFNKYNDKIYLKFNFNGLNKKYIDKFNGLKGSYDILLRVLDLIEPFFSIASFNTTKENVNEIYATGKFLKEKGINRFNVTAALNFGRAEINNLSYDDEIFFKMEKQMKNVTVQNSMVSMKK
jgi:MoaA/NifB/PqqE/SkfB family radical SAM enzyme